MLISGYYTLCINFAKTNKSTNTCNSLAPRSKTQESSRDASGNGKLSGLSLPLIYVLFLFLFYYAYLFPFPNHQQRTSLGTLHLHS